MYDFGTAGHFLHPDSNQLVNVGFLAMAMLSSWSVHTFISPQHHF